VLLPAEEMGSQRSQEQLNVWAGSMSLERSLVSKVRVSGGAEQDISK